MRTNMVPANISLMELTPNRLAFLKPVTTLDITDGATQNFHEDGLFSTSIFGRVGSEQRDNKFSYIDIKIPIFHPLIYRNLVKLKGIYAGIISGRIYARWDEKEKDFIQCDELQGDTGYYFFYSHWKKIVFKQTGSDLRDLKIRFIDKYKDRAETTKVIVIPAGLRDVHYDPSGRMKMDEINDIYRGMLSISNAISKDADYNSSLLDVTRNSLQNQFNKLFDHIQNLLDGKGGFLQRKWASRKIYNGTRNVITAMDTSTPRLGMPNSPKQNHTVLGVYQMAKAALPKTKYAMLNGFLGQVFNRNDAQVRLVDPKTLRPKDVYLDAETIDRWSTSDGIEKIINSLSEASLRARPIKIADHYLGLVYIGPDATYRIFNDISELPENRDPKDVHPITLLELVYLSCHEMWSDLVGFVTRYPITGEGSSYASRPYVKTTVVGEMRSPLNERWEIDALKGPAVEFPTYGSEEYVESLSPSPSRLAGLGGDSSIEVTSLV